MASPSGQIPGALTPLVGRADQVAELGHRLERHRLVTLTGMGGVGKSRLAMAIAEQMAEQIAEMVSEQEAGRPVIWLDLNGLPPQEQAATRFGGDVAGQLAAVVCGAADPDRPSQERLTRALAGRPVLIVLDGCDRHVPACRELVTHLLQACARLRVLTTSREVLGVPGELTWPVPGLPVAGGQDDAVQLFLARAAEARPALAAAGPVVERICRRLDGLPLAIELAAARVRVLSVEQLADGLDDCLTLLAAPRSPVPERHRTLQATLDFSHDRLPPAESALFRRLAVFAGGAGLAAVESLAAGDAVDDADDDSGEGALEPLTRLVERSLVQVQQAGATTRYHLPDAVRQYAAARLADSGEEHRVRARHAAWCVQLTSGSIDSSVWLDSIEAELDNLRAGLHWAAEHDPALALRLAGRLWRFGWRRGRYAEGRSWTERALRAVPIEDDASRLERHLSPSAVADQADLARVLHGAGVLAYLQCDYDEALIRLEAARLRYDRADHGAIGDVEQVLRCLAGIARERGDYPRASAILGQVRDRAQAAGDQAGAARCDVALALTAWLAADLAEAERRATAALAGYRRLGDRAGSTEAEVLLGLAELAGGAADQAATSRAADRLRATLAEGEQLDLCECVAYSLHGLGVAAGPDRDPELARPLLTRALAVHRELGDRWRAASVLDDLARCALAAGDRAEAGRLLGEADAARAAIGAPVPAVEAPARAELVAALNATLVPTPAVVRGAAQAAVTSSSMVVRSFGGSVVSLAGVTVDAGAWGYAKPRELLHFLLVSAPVGKGEIGAALWPDADPQALRGAFHTTLNRLRRVVGAQRIVYAGGRYSIEPTAGAGAGLDHDVAAFRTSLRAARAAEPDQRIDLLRAAARLYRGEFLAGEVSGEWAVEVREQLARAAERTLLELGQLLLERGEAGAAVPVFRRAVELDPLLESAHRGLMRCQVRLGEPTRALRQFEQLQRALRAAVDAEPAPGTAALAERIRCLTP